MHGSGDAGDGRRHRGGAQGREEKAEEVRLLRQQECDDQNRLEAWWKNVKEQVRAAMEASGYHNPKGRGWRKSAGAAAPRSKGKSERGVLREGQKPPQSGRVGAREGLTITEQKTCLRLSVSNGS